jgi:HD-GYP domain-containing protein (c-di-GMP phosphodiesterase class II)
VPALKALQLTEEFIDKIRQTKEIPVHFYNKEGQILIYKKENCTEEELRRLLKFRGQGIYFDEEDIEKLALSLSFRDWETPEGLTDTKLINKQYTDEMLHTTEGLFNDLKEASLRTFHVKESSERMGNLFNDFAGQEDAMTGLVNILEVLQSKDTSYFVEIAVKRTVVAMALKTRGMQTTIKLKNKEHVKEGITDLMLSSMLCDIGYFQMQIPRKERLTIEEMHYIKRHPLMSYLMVAHEPSLSNRAKHNILTHHRPRFDDHNDNNYPPLHFLTVKLEELKDKFKQEPKRKPVVDDLQKQLEYFKKNVYYHEDANILCIASEFASLTSDVPWRKAYSSVEAVKSIINNSYFTYTARIIHQFLDYLAISLCDNRMILREGDFVIVVLETHHGSNVFEVCQIDSISRFQSRPRVRRIATVKPLFSKEPKLMLTGFDLDKVEFDKRRAHFELTQDGSRRIIYAVDPKTDKHFYLYLINNT